MIQLLVEGGVFFTLPLTVLALLMIGQAIRKGLDLFVRKEKQPADLKRGLATILQVGGFAFAFGLLGLGISLRQAFAAIEAMGGVSPALLAGGLKVALIVPLYGLLIFLGASVLWFVLRQRYERLTAQAG